MKSSIFKRLAGAMVLAASFIFSAHAAWQPGLQGGYFVSSGGTSIAANLDKYPEELSACSDPYAATNKVSSTSTSTVLWKNYQTWVYVGQIYFANPGRYWFGENIDDSTWLKIGEKVILNDTAYNVVAYGYIDVDVAGWQSFELRMYNGTGGAGSNGAYNGWAAGKGFGWYYAGDDTTTQYNTASHASLYTYPVDTEENRVFRYDDGKGFEDLLTITGNPKNIGTVSPAYGTKAENVNGSTFECSATSPIVIDGTTWEIAGYDVYDIDITTGERTGKVEALSGSGSSFTYTHGTTMRELVWNWTQTKHAITVDNNTLATIIGGGVYNHNATVTISVTAFPSSSEFFNWTGNLPEGIDITSPTVTFTADASYTFIPVFATSYYVSNNGNHTTPFDTWETAATNIEDAVAIAQSVADAPAKILIDEGDYKITKLPYLNITNPVQIIGKGADKTRIIAAYVHEPARSAGRQNNYKRHFDINHKDAVLDGLMLKDGHYEHYYAEDDNVPQTKGVGSITLINSTIKNCVFTNCHGNDEAGAVYVDGGVVESCHFYGNKSYRGNNGGASIGGAMTINGGIVTDCVISNNTAYNNGSDKGNGAGAFVTGNGVLRNSLIVGNKAGTLSGRNGAGISITGNGLVENCVISNNYNVQYGGGVFMNGSGATLRNCLVTHNTAQDEGGGVYLKKGKIEFCTISKNNSTNKKGSGLYCSSSSSTVVIGNIIYGNGVDIGTEPICNFAGTLPNTYTMNVVSPAGNNDNIDSDPLFTNPNTNDFTPGPGSPAIDGYTDEDAPSVDLLNAVRPKDGDGDGTKVPDIGCYEVGGVDEGPLRGTISADETSGYDSLTVILTANLAGAGKDDVSYEWNFGGGQAQGSATGAEVTVNYPDYGSYNVSLKVTPASGTPMILHLAEPVRVGSQRVWVGNSSGKWPYQSKETATNDVCEVVNSALIIGDGQVEVIVADGDYEIKEKWVSLTANIYLHGENGRGKSVLYGNRAGKGGSSQAALYIANANAVVSDLTITNCNWDGNGSGITHGAVNLTSGTIRDCTLTRLRGGNKGGALTLGNGVADNLLIYDCESSGNSNPGVGEGVVYVNGAGILKNSVISNNCAMASGGGIYLNHKDGIVSNCVIVGNATGRGVGLNYSRKERQANRKAGGVQIGAGLMVDCFIEGNYATGTGGGVYMNGADSRMVNCLVAENAAKYGEHGVRLESSATIINGTIANNGANALETVDLAGAGLSMTNGTSYLKNTIVYHNVNSAKQLVVSEENAANVQNCCAPSTELTADENGNINEEPGLRNIAKGDYRLSSGSACINAGDNSFNEWPKDLYGKDRVFNGLIDIGAHEYHRVHTMMIVR